MRCLEFYACWPAGWLAFFLARWVACLLALLALRALLALPALLALLDFFAAAIAVPLEAVAPFACMCHV